jgi:Uma2 family endonuclease
MATATAAPTTDERPVLLKDISWEAYEALLKSWERRRVRLTYDHGALEIMSPSRRHGKFGSLIGQFIELYTLHRNIPRQSGGSITFREEAKERGLEPDECYWIQNEEAMRGVADFDFERHPAPDLAVEIDITSSSLNRMSIYADLGVPEIWRFDGRALTIHLLGPDGKYPVAEISAALPGLPPSVVLRFLRRGERANETTLMRSFLDWVRKQSAAKPKRRRPPKK